MTESKVHHSGPWIFCKDCHHGHETDLPEQFRRYFFEESTSCPECGTETDWWDAILSSVREHFMLTGAFHVIGATTTILSPRLQRNVTVSVDLCEYGVPQSAIVLNSNLMGSPLFPVIWHGNVPRHDPLNKKWLLYGAPFGTDAVDGEAQLAITWIAPDTSNASFLQLVEAVRVYDSENYPSIVVPANVSVECELSAACYAWLSSNCSKDRARQFLEEAATYAHQLNVLLPVACRELGFVALPDHIVGLLNRLRKLRNELAHRGALREPLSRADAAGLLTAAIFAFHYVSLFRSEIEKYKTRVDSANSKRRPTHN